MKGKSNDIDQLWKELNLETEHNKNYSYYEDIGGKCYLPWFERNINYIQIYKHFIQTGFACDKTRKFLVTYYNNKL